MLVCCYCVKYSLLLLSMFQPVHHAVFCQVSLFLAFLFSFSMSSSLSYHSPSQPNICMLLALPTHLHSNIINWMYSEKLFEIIKLTYNCLMKLKLSKYVDCVILLSQNSYKRDEMDLFFKATLFFSNFLFKYKYKQIL